VRFVGFLGNVCVLAAILLVFLTKASFSQDADTSADLQCLVAIMETGPQIDKVAPGSSQVAAMYFLGRIDGRAPTLDLEKAIRRVAASMSRKDISAADMRCGKQLTARGQTMQAIGEHLILNPQGNGKGTGGPSHAS
jgi:hypothetical protein